MNEGLQSVVQANLRTYRLQPVVVQFLPGLAVPNRLVFLREGECIWRQENRLGKEYAD